LSLQIFVAVLSQMVKGQRHIKSQEVLPFFVAFVAPQDQLDEFQDSEADSIMDLP